MNAAGRRWLHGGKQGRAVPPPALPTTQADRRNLQASDAQTRQGPSLPSLGRLETLPQKWIPKASLWRSLRQSLNLACFLCLALPNRGRRVRDLAGTQRSLRRLRRGLGRIDCRAWFFDDGNVRYNNDSGGQCGELAGSGSAGARVVWRWQNAGEREGCVWQGRGRFGRARQAYTGCCVWRGCGAAAGVAQTGGGAA